MSTSSASPHSSGYIVGNKPLHYFISILLVLLTFYCLSTTFSRGAANAWYFNAEFSLNDWAKKRTIKDKADYESTLNSIKKAQSLDPTHPHYVHMVGRIMHWGVDMGYEEKTELVEIIQWYRLATQLRPLWPDPWVDLLRLNNYLYGYTDETKYYIKQALSRGPYIDLVTVGTVQVWLSNWPLLSGKDRELLFKQFAITTKQHKALSQMLKFAQAINREKLLCSQLKFNPSYSKQKDSYAYRNYCLK
jgi:hypothetical protein